MKKSQPEFPDWLESKEIPDSIKDKFKTKFQRVISHDHDAVLDDLVAIARLFKDRLYEIEAERQEDLPFQKITRMSERQRAEEIVQAIHSLADKLDAISRSIMGNFAESGVDLFDLAVAVSAISSRLNKVKGKDPKEISSNEKWLRDVVTQRPGRGTVPGQSAEDREATYFVAKVFLRLHSNNNKLTCRTLTRVNKFLCGAEYEREAAWWISISQTGTTSACRST